MDDIAVELIYPAPPVTARGPSKYYIENKYRSTNLETKYRPCV